MHSEHRRLVMASSRSGKDLALTTEECVLLAAVRNGTPHLTADQFFLVENALERLGRLSLLVNGTGIQRDRRL